MRDSYFNNRPKGNVFDQGLSDEWLQNIFEFIQQNGNFDNGMIATGHNYSPTDLWNMQFELNKISDERAWQEDMYNRYQSIPAQVRQMQEAGLNPALMYGSGAQTGSMPSTSGGTGSPASGRGAGSLDATSKMSSIVSAVLSMLSGASGIGSQISQMTRNKHQNEKDDAQAALFAEQQNTEKDKQNQLAAQALYDRSRARLNEIDATYRDSLNKWQVESMRQQYIKTYQETQKILSDIDVNDSIIKINGKQLEILDKNLSIQEQELQLKSLQVLMKNREALIQPDMLELQKQYLEAQVLTEEARTETEKAYAEEARANAANALWDAITKKKLIDIEYYEQQLRNMKVQNGVAITHAIVDSACRISSEALGWATFGLSKVGSNTESSIIQPAYGGPQPTFKGLYN